MTEDMKAQEKIEMTPAQQAENTFSEPAFSPPVDICESDTGLTLVADMPGVAPENLFIDLKDGVLTISGKVDKADGNLKVLAAEYKEGDYYRQFALSEAIDQEKISAALKNGVLVLEMPKIAPVQPRRIVVKGE